LSGSDLIALFHTKDIEAAIEKGRRYNPDDFNPYYFIRSIWVNVKV
jgi:hypothetical protein